MNAQSKIQLRFHNLPVIETLEDFSDITHISKYSLYHLSKESYRYYKCYEIPKKSGGKRFVCQPSYRLKGLQSWVLVNILNKLSTSESCVGFEKGTSIADNARSHVEANTVLNMDIKDFFPSITRNKVFNVFKSIGYNNLISTILTNICVYNERLPQGSPCSPKLANLISLKMDIRIQGFVGKRGITYTRYADDLTFSGLNPNSVARIIPIITQIINEEGFQVNEKKTRIAGSSRAKIVTGLVLSEGEFGIGRNKYKVLRAKIYQIATDKVALESKEFESVKGYLAFLKSVDEKRYKKVIYYIKNLSKINENETLIEILPKNTEV